MKNRMKRICSFLLCFSIGISTFFMSINDVYATEGLKIHYIHVGSGDAIYIECEGYNMLIDGGYLTEADRENDATLMNPLDSQMHDQSPLLDEQSEDFTNQYRQLLKENDNSDVMKYLKAMNVTHINYIVSTHPHFDHIGGLLQVLNQVTYDHLYYNGKDYTTRYYRYFMKLANDNVESQKVSAALEVPELHQEWNIGSAKVKVVSDQTIDYSTISGNADYKNNESLVLRMDYGKRSFLFTGDAQVALQKQLILNQPSIFNVDVLKVPHHGHTNNDFGVSEKSGNYEFFKAVNPILSMIQCGLKNTSFSIPSRKVLQDLSMSDVYTTKDYGNVVLECDGDDIVIRYGEQSEKYDFTITGDVNGNGRIDAADYLMIKDTIMGKLDLKSLQKKHADVNKNLRMDAADYLKIKDFIIGKISSL